MTTYHRTRLDNIVTSSDSDEPDRDGCISTVSVLTGRPYGRLRLSGLRPATAEEVQRAESECLALATSEVPPYDCELARAKVAARRRLRL